METTKRKIGKVYYRESVEICEEYFDRLLYTEEPKELIQIGNREINEFELEVLTALKRKRVALKRACCGEEEEEYC